MRGKEKAKHLKSFPSGCTPFRLICTFLSKRTRHIPPLSTKHHRQEILEPNLNKQVYKSKRYSILEASKKQIHRYTTMTKVQQTKKKIQVISKADGVCTPG